MSTVRHATPADLPGAYRVCLLTGDAGRDGTALHRDPDLLGHVFVGPYVTGSPDLAYVVEDEGGIAGYCLAVADTRAFEAWQEAAWWPPLRERYPLPADDTPDGELVRLLHAPSTAADATVAAWPAHLHIDLLAHLRGQGLGRTLVERQMADLAARGIPGLHLEVAADNPGGIAFYRRLGFAEIARGKGSIVMARAL